MITAVVVCAAQTVLILALLVQCSRRRRAEEALRETETALRASCTDAQHLAGRLMATQESERYRVARDLHDNLGQKLALLCIDIQQLATRLVETARTISLHVADDGKGFDRTSYSGAGLGLLSMRERAHLAGGRLGIRTRIGTGTRIVVTLPVTGALACESRVNSQESDARHRLEEVRPAHAAMQGRASHRLFEAFRRGLLARTVVDPARRPLLE